LSVQTPGIYCQEIEEIMIDKVSMLEHISFLKKGLLEVIKHFFAEDSKFILYFVCAVGTSIGLALSVTCLLWEEESLGLLGIGLITSVICFAVFLYTTLKMG
jgi:hypothetical protein